MEVKIKEVVDFKSLFLGIYFNEIIINIVK